MLGLDRSQCPGGGNRWSYLKPRHNSAARNKNNVNAARNKNIIMRGLTLKIIYYIHTYENYNCPFLAATATGFST